MTTVTADDLGKPIRTAQGDRIGTLREIDGPTIYILMDEDIDRDLLNDMKVSETTAKKYEGQILAGATMGAVAEVDDDGIRFWPSYATESSHESISYGDVPEEDGQTNPEADR